ncbi:MAG: membrane protein insertase YidC [Bacteroidota bacterium]
MERDHIIGFILLFATLFVWSYLNRPDQAELERRQRMQDSIASIEAARDSLNTSAQLALPENQPAVSATLPDSVRLAQNASLFGPFASSSVGEEKTFTLENSKIKFTFSNKGGKIVSAELKNYTKEIRERGKDVVVEQIVMLNDPRNKFEYLLPVASTPSGIVTTEDLYFDANVTGNTITFKANTSLGAAFTQTYTLDQESYNLDYDVNYKGLERVFGTQVKSIVLNWDNFLHPYERNARFEQQYSAVYYKESDEDVDDCGCMQDDKKELDKRTIDWVSHSNQYFNSTLIADSSPFESAVVESIGPSLGRDSDADHMERLTSEMQIPIEGGGNFAMSMYVGPNEYENLSNYNISLEYIIPFGNSIFGSINRWVIRPVFDFMSRYIGSLGIVIIIVIFIIKMMLYPLMYKMLHSQALMGALKPELAHLTEKFKDDPQKKQIETMKIYREYGVSPLGGCLPMLIQMPIWYALFRFFPASISFRQESFLWAHDLSSYDDFFHLPFHIPFVGDHLSLFTILYSISMLAYTYYNTRHMDMSANPAMKYMQYLMPVMFFGFFNTYASGLTAYMFFSNLINISQTVLTKRFVFKGRKAQRRVKGKKSKAKEERRFSGTDGSRIEAATRVAGEKAKETKKIEFDF